MSARSRVLPWLAGTTGLLALCACSPSLTTLQPARTVPAGHVQATSAVDFTMPRGRHRQLMEDARDVHFSRRMSPSDIEVAADGLAAALIQAPSVGTRLALAYGVSRRLEIGARSSISSVGAYGRWQFLRKSPGIYGALGIGLSYYYMPFPVDHFVDEVEIESYRRVDFDIPLSFGYSSRNVHLWAGPKLVVGHYEGRFAACIDERRGNCRRQIDAAMSGRASYVAMQMGIAVGHRRWFVAAELTLARLGAEADLTVDGNDGDLSTKGLVVNPAVGLFIWI